MTNTHNKTEELHSVMLAGVADLPLFVHVCVWRKMERGEERRGEERRGEGWKKNSWLLEFQIA